MQIKTGLGYVDTKYCVINVYDCFCVNNLSIPHVYLLINVKLPDLV